MTELDPIIAVKDVEKSAKWYERIFLFKKSHGGDNFSVMISSDDQIILCLHKWQEHDHPTMNDPGIPAGNGVLLYFRTENMHAIYQNAIKEGCIIEEDLHLNPNSLKNEFSIRDPDGYYLTVTEFHKYKG